MNLIYPTVDMSKELGWGYMPVILNLCLLPYHMWEVKYSPISNSGSPKSALNVGVSLNQ